MTNVSDAAVRDWQNTASLSGVTTASLLTVILVSTIVGGLAGMFLNGSVSPALTAVLAGLTGTLAAGLARNTVLIRAWNAAGIDDGGTPAAVIALAAVASLAGSLAAYELIGAAGPVWPGVTGMFAGLLSGVLMGLLIIAHRMQPESADCAL